MATLPTIPSFAYQETPTTAKLNQLSAAATFATQMPIVVSCKKNAAQSVPANTASDVVWDIEETDTDGMFSATVNPSRFTAQTQGYFKFHATVAASTGTTTAYMQIYFQQTTGSNNPQGAGHAQIFGAAAYYTGWDYKALTISSITPCLYVNDYIEVYIYPAAAVTVQNRTWWGTGWGYGDGSPCACGYYLCEGP